MNDPYLTDWARHQHDLDDGKRAGYIAGMRALMDVLEAHEDIPLPHHGDGSPLMLMFFDGDARALMAATARALPCSWEKEVRNDYFDLNGNLDGLKVQLTAARDEVCTRVITGTREVTETVKDPEALAAVPEIEVTRTEDVIEWRCESVLAPRETTGEAA